MTGLCVSRFFVADKLLSSHTFFNQSQVLVLALDNALEILDILSQLFHLCLVELLCLLGGLFNVETGSHVDQDGLGAC